MASTRQARGRGRPPAATREEVVRLALGRYLHGQRVDVQAIAAELGLSRATIYRWFGSREGLIGEVVLDATRPLLHAAHERASGRGAERLLDTFDRFNREIAAAPALLRFIEQERDVALRVITSGAGVVQPGVVGMIEALIELEVREAGYRPAVEAATLAYAIVKLAEAFLFNDAVAGIRGDVERLRELEAVLLGVSDPGRAFGPGRVGSPPTRDHGPHQAST